MLIFNQKKHNLGTRTIHLKPIYPYIDVSLHTLEEHDINARNQALSANKNAWFIYFKIPYSKVQLSPKG